MNTKYIGWNGTKWLPVTELHQGYEQAGTEYLPTTLSAKLADGSSVKFDTEKNEFPVRQSTRQQDTNGAEIYEGDLVKVDHFPKPLEIRWVGSGLVCFIDDDNWGFIDAFDHLDVVGNVWEHPDLLKVAS
jgi:hypothetical protein